MKKKKMKKTIPYCLFLKAKAMNQYPNSKVT